MRADASRCSRACDCTGVSCMSRGCTSCHSPPPKSPRHRMPVLLVLAPPSGPPVHHFCLPPHQHRENHAASDNCAGAETFLHPPTHATSCLQVLPQSRRQLARDFQDVFVLATTSTAITASRLSLPFSSPAPSSSTSSSTSPSPSTSHSASLYSTGLLASPSSTSSTCSPYLSVSHHSPGLLPRHLSSRLTRRSLSLIFLNHDCISRPVPRSPPPLRSQSYRSCLSRSPLWSMMH